MDLNHLEALLKYRLWAPPWSFLSRFGAGPENLNFSQDPRWGWCWPHFENHWPRAQGRRCPPVVKGSWLGDVKALELDAPREQKDTTWMAEVRFTGSKMEWDSGKGWSSSEISYLPKQLSPVMRKNLKEEAFGTPMGCSRDRRYRNTNKYKNRYRNRDRLGHLAWGQERALSPREQQKQQWRGLIPQGLGKNTTDFPERALTNA